MNRWIEAAIRNRGLTLLLAAGIAFAGIYSFQHLNIDAVPDITNVQVTVSTSVDGLVPNEIEKYITFPVESAMGGIPGIEEIRSISRFGLSQVTIVFEEGSDIYLARQLVSEKLQDVRKELPQGAEPKLGPITTGLGEIYFYSLEYKEVANDPAGRLRQLMELRTLNEWYVKPRLLLVPGVAEVNVIGGYEKRFYIQPDLKKLNQYGIDFHDLVSAVEDNNRSTGGGYIQQTAEQLLVQASGLVSSVEELNEIIVKTLPSLQTIQINDVAKVGLAKELRTGAALVNGEEAVLGTVLMLLGENSRAVSIDVHEKIQEVRKGLPQGVEIQTLYNRSSLVNSTLDTVQSNLLFGALLVVLVLLLLTGNIRVAVITAATIPLSLLSAFIAMRYFDVSGNLMSLGALDFGIIIDGAVIVMDSIVRKIAQYNERLGRRLNRKEIEDAVVEGTIEIRSAAGFAQLIVVIVFLPLFALTGVEGKMFVPMAATFCFALASAFVFSFSVIPALAAFFLPGFISSQENTVMKFLQRLYAPILEFILKWRKTVIGIGLAFVALGGIGYWSFGSDFLPQLDEGSIAIQFVRPTNIAIDQSVVMQSQSEKIIREFEEVSLVLSRIGTAEVATDPMGPNLADTFILLKDEDLWPEVDGQKRTKFELIQAMKKRLELLIPGQTMIISQPIQLRFNELLEGVRSDVALKIYGEDMAVITQAAEEAARIVSSIDGAGDSEEEVKGKSPVMRILPKTNALKELGMPKENLLSTVESALGGAEAGYLYEGVTRYPIIVRLDEKDRSDVSKVRKLPVAVVENFTVPLEDVAEVKFEETYSDIRRESAKKRSAVLINVRGRDTSSFVEEAKQKVEESLDLPPGYYIEWGGSFQNLEQAKQRLTFLVPIAVFLVLLLIYMAFRNLIQTVMVAVCIPFALVGGVGGLMLRGLEFSISAAVGFIALSGLAVLNGIVLVSYLNRLKLQGLSGDELIKEGTRMRLRPVAMTAISTAFGFLPMMFSTGRGAEVQQPLASVVVGGIISATALTLLVLPVVYRLLENKMKIRESGMDH